MRDQPPERRGAHPEAPEGAAVPFVDEMDVVLADAEPAGQELARRIDVLPMAPEGELVALPLGDPAEGLHRDDATAAEIIGELAHDGGFREALVDIAVVPAGACTGLV